MHSIEKSTLVVAMGINLAKVSFLFYREYILQLHKTRFKWVKTTNPNRLVKTFYSGRLRFERKLSLKFHRDQIDGS